MSNMENTNITLSNEESFDDRRARLFGPLSKDEKEDLREQSKKLKHKYKVWTNGIIYIVIARVSNKEFYDWNQRALTQAMSNTNDPIEGDSEFKKLMIDEFVVRPTEFDVDRDLLPGEKANLYESISELYGYVQYNVESL